MPTLSANPLVPSQKLDREDLEMNKPDDKLNPCACGGATFFVIATAQGLWRVECSDCHLRSMWYKSEADALKFWNHERIK